MRKSLILISCLILITGGMISRAQTTPIKGNDAKTVMPDSTVDIIGWFCKNDTIEYWINESEWKFNDGDTIKTSGVSTKMRITVTDSTANGYKMNYTFMDFASDSIENSPLGEFQNKIIAKLKNKFIGTTIKFETDEYGIIKKCNNLGQIKKQAKELFNDAMKELYAQPEFKKFEEAEVDIKKIAKNVIKDVVIDDLVDSYTEELKLLFCCHGKSFDIGEKHIHQDATETDLENDTYITASIDAENWTYHLSSEVVSIIPKSLMKDAIGEIVNILKDTDLSTDDNKLADFHKEFDSYVDVDGTAESYFGIDYFSNGWPYQAIEQSTTMAGKFGKAKQTYIYVDYCNW